MMKILKNGTSILIISCLCLVASKSCFAMDDDLPLDLKFEYRSPGSFLSYAFSKSDLNPNDYKIKNENYEKKLQKTTHIGKDINSFLERFEKGDYASKIENILKDLTTTNIIDCLCYVQDYLTYDYCRTVQRGIELDKKPDTTSDESKELIECMQKAKSIQNLLCNTLPSETVQILKVWELGKAEGTNRWSRFVTSNWDKLSPNYNILCPEMDEVFVRTLKLHNSEMDDDTQDALLAQFQLILYKKIDTSEHIHSFRILYNKKIGELLYYKKFREAEQLLEIGANLGDELALRTLCKIYEDNLKDKVSKSIYWHKKAQTLGYCKSAYALATLYEKESELQDLKKAFKYYKMADEEFPNDCRVLYKLGHYYLKRLGGIPKDEKLAFKYFQRAADSGDINAKYYLGYCYTNGVGTVSDYCRAAELLESIPIESALPKISNNISAMLGVCYSQGFKDPEHIQLAIHHLELAANHGNEISAFQLGYLYYTGKKVTKDFEKAFKYFKQSAEKNHMLAIYYLAQCYMDGSGCEKNVEKALELYHKDADEFKYSKAMICLSKYYSKIPEYHTKAIEYLTRASDLNDDDATIVLGRCYRDGFCSIPVNLDEAIKLLKKIADKGNIAAMKNLGDCYYMKKLDDQAFQMYNKASDLGSLEAKYDLARCYTEACGCSRNWPLAVKLYKESKPKCPKAAYELGKCYSFGYGCDKSLDFAETYYKESISTCKEDKKYATAALTQVLLTKNSDDKEYIFKLCHEAAENDFPMSIYTLAYLYMHGIGVEKNETLAKEWYQKAKKDNIDETIKFYVDNDLGLACDSDQKIQWLEEIAEYGENAYAMYKLGLLCKDEERALAYLKKAADKGSEDAMYALLTKEKEKKQAAVLYEKLLEKAKDSHKTKYYVACCLESGLGVDRNINKAIQFCRDAILACPNATSGEKDDAKKSTCKGERQLGSLKSLYQNIETTFIPETHPRAKRSPISKLEFVKDSMVKIDTIEWEEKSAPQPLPYTARYWNRAVQADAKKNLDAFCEWNKNLEMLLREQRTAYTTKRLARLKGTPLVSIEGKDIFDLINEKKLNYTLYEARLNNAQGEKDGSVIIYGVDEENKEIVIFYIGQRFGAQHKNEISINLEAEEKGILVTEDDDKKTC